MTWLLLALWLVVQPIPPPIMGFWQGDTLYLQITQPLCLSMYGNGVVSAVPLPDSCNVQSYQLNQDDPDLTLRPWGRTLVLLDPETQREVGRWVVPLRDVLWIPRIVRSDQPMRLAGVPLSANWIDDILQVEVTTPASCLYLIGNLRPSQWIGCGEPTYTLYPSGDQNRVPMNRILVIVGYAGQELARLRAPPRIVVWMPLMAH